MRPLGVEISALLADRGVTTVFGIPGVHNIELYRGIEAAGLTHVLARNEMGAGFMADGYARATGRPGVAFVISGPGLTNIMTPLGQAYSDSVPVLVIASVLDEVETRKGQLHQMRDQLGAGGCVAETSVEVRSAEAAFEAIDAALIAMEGGRARPHVVHVPVALMGAPAPSFPKLARKVTSPEAADVEDIADLLSQSARPLFIFGGGAVNATDIAALLDRTGAASFTTYAGRGIVAGAAPYHFGATLARASSADVLAMADLVIAVGTELAEVDLWRDDPGHRCPMVRVDLDPAVLSASGADHQVAADAARFLSDLCAAVSGPPATGWTGVDVAGWRARWRREVAAEFPGVVPVVDALGAAVPGETMIFSDMTQFAYAAKEVWDMPRPGHWHHPFGFGTLGYGVPAAIGGALGHDGPVMAIAGDSGLQYTLPELGTAAELGVSLPIILWDNEALKMIEDGMIAAQIAPNAVHQVNPDWASLAAAYRIGFEQPASLDAIGPALTRALSAGRPTLIRLTPALSSSS